jgi:hypothetical protein
MKEFPIGEATAIDTAVWAERKIRKALALESTKCIGVVNETHSRCERGTGGQRMSNCALTIDEIVKPDIYQNDSYFEGLIRVLEKNIYCDQHINEKDLQHVALWKSSIAKILKDNPIKGIENDAIKETGKLPGAPNGSGPSTVPRPAGVMTLSPDAEMCQSPTSMKT